MRRSILVPKPKRPRDPELTARFDLSAQQQQNNPTSQPPAAGGLFGSSTQQSTQAGSLFGGPAAQQAQQTGGGLFGGSTNTSQPQQTTSLFGNTQNNPTTGTQQGGGGGLFGGSLSQTTQQPQQQGASLFGSTLNVPTQQPQQTSSLFGGLNQSTQQQPQQQSGGLFGNLNQPAQQQQGSSLFGNTQQNRPSLFGSSTTNNAAPAGGSLFSNPNPFGSSTQQQNQPQQAPQNSIFGLSAHPPQVAQSMLGASQYRSSQYQPFAGKLSMGQSATAPGVPQAQVQSAVKINFEEMRPTTRFADCIEDIQKQLEAIDKMIQSQEEFCRKIETFIPNHGNDVASLQPDVEIVKEKAEAAEGSLSVDAGGIESARKVLEKDQTDFRRCERVVLNLAQPIQYRYTGNYGSAVQPSYTSTGVDGEAARDMDLIGNYFTPMAADMKKTLDSYASNLSEIEGHMRVIEQSTVAQAQQLAAKRAGGSTAVSADDTVRELAGTLRGFEASILGAAGLVGQCREGLNELVLGRLGGVVGRR